MTEPIRVIVADDHPLFRKGIGALIEESEQTELVGEASSGDEVIALVAREAPDVVLMDLQMPGMSGIDATRSIVERMPRTAVLVLTMMDDDQSVFAAMRAGARGYVLKGATSTEILRAISAVASGDVLFGAPLAARITRFFDKSPEAHAVFPQLTSREREVLDLLATGLDNTTIARRLFLSEKTVRNNVSSTIAKLQVRDRSEAVARARDAGLGSSG